MSYSRLTRNDTCRDSVCSLEYKVTLIFRVENYDKYCPHSGQLLAPDLSRVPQYGQFLRSVCGCETGGDPSMNLPVSLMLLSPILSAYSSVYPQSAHVNDSSVAVDIPGRSILT